MIEADKSSANAEVRELTLRTPFLRLAAKAWGGESGKPVLALHGWLDNAGTFDALAPRLPGLNLVALDLPGHGLSEHRPAGVHYHFVDYIADVLAAADALGWRRFSLLGHSMGAGIASFVGAVAPERVQRLALIEGLGPLSMGPTRGPKAHAEAIRQMSAMATRRVPTYGSLEEAARARHGAGDLELKSARTLVRRGAQYKDGRVVWRTDPRLKMKSPHYYSERQVRAYLQKIQAPTRVLVSDQGLLANRNMKRRYACVDRLETFQIAGGHHPHLDLPESVAPLVAGFLS